MITGLLLAALLAVLAALVAVLYRLHWVQERHRFAQAANHAVCTSMVAAYVGDSFAAQVLMAAANDYDTAEGQTNLRLLSQTVWAEGGPSVPSLWMRDRAETILSKTHSDDSLHVPDTTQRYERGER